MQGSILSVHVIDARELRPANGVVANARVRLDIEGNPSRTQEVPSSNNPVWNEVIANIELFKQLRQQYSNIQLQCCSTVNIFNVYYIDQLANWIVKQGFNFVYWNIMHEAWYFSIAALPESAKTEIAQHLNAATTPYKKDFVGIVDFMLNGQSTDGTKICQEIQKLDQRRQQNLRDVAPELAEIIKYGQA